MSKNSAQFERAKKVIPGGVDSPVRAFGAVGGTPRFIEKADGAFIWDVEGKKYIDLIGSWGPMILGHGHSEVTKAVTKQVAKGLSYGAPSPLETDLAELIIDMMPNIEKIRFVSSGTEACMTALRIARGYTGRDKILKFEGCYHGHSDSLLVKAGSGCLTFGTPSSPGVPADTTKHTLTLDFNDIEQVKAIFAEQGDKIACVILEPITGNMNMIKPKPGFLETLRELCTAHGTVLIFDEVMTGFRVAQGGVQSLYNIKPDLTTLGKVIGGGLPVGAVGGTAEIMSCLSPEGPVYQAGTLSGCPVAMAAGIATLKQLKDDVVYEELEVVAKEICDHLNQIQMPHYHFSATYCGGMMGIVLAKGPTPDVPKHPESFAALQAMLAPAEVFQKLFHELLEQGVMYPPSAYEASFLSLPHCRTKGVRPEILKTMEQALQSLQALSLDTVA